MKIIRPMPPLRRRMLEDMQIRNYSPHTIDGALSTYSCSSRLEVTEGRERISLGPLRPLSSPLRSRDLSPHLHSLLHCLTVYRRRKQMPSWSKVLGDGAIRRAESLGVPR